MALSVAAAYIIGSIIMSVISIATSVASYAIPKAEAEKYRKLVSERKASYGDLIKLVDTITARSSTLTTSQRKRMQTGIDRLLNKPYISSGLTEAEIGRVRSRLNDISTEIERKVGVGQTYEKMADNQAAAYSAYSDEEKSKAKNSDGTWDTSTAAGRAGSEAQKYSELANKEYQEANALGEKYV